MLKIFQEISSSNKRSKQEYKRVNRRFHKNDVSVVKDGVDGLYQKQHQHNKWNVRWRLNYFVDQILGTGTNAWYPTFAPFPSMSQFLKAIHPCNQTVKASCRSILQSSSKLRVCEVKGDFFRWVVRIPCCEAKWCEWEGGPIRLSSQ